MTGPILTELTPEEAATKKARLDREAASELERERLAGEADDADNRKPPVAVPINNPRTDANAPKTSQAGSFGTRVPTMRAAADGRRAKNNHSPAHSYGNRGGTRRNRSRSARALNMNALEAEINGQRVYTSLLHNIVGVKNIWETISEDQLQRTPGLA